MSGANNKLIKIGIPEKYFMGTLFNVNDKIREQAKNFVLGVMPETNPNDKKKYFSIFQELLKKDYEEITIQCEENGEEIPVIAFMCDLHRRILKLSALKKEYNNKIRDEICKMMGKKAKMRLFL